MDNLISLFPSCRNRSKKRSLRDVPQKISSIHWGKFVRCIEFPDGIFVDNKGNIHRDNPSTDVMLDDYDDSSESSNDETRYYGKRRRLTEEHFAQNRALSIQDLASYMSEEKSKSESYYHHIAENQEEEDADLSIVDNNDDDNDGGDSDIEYQDNDSDEEEYQDDDDDEDDEDDEEEEEYHGDGLDVGVNDAQCESVVNITEAEEGGGEEEEEEYDDNVSENEINHSSGLAQTEEDHDYNGEYEED